MLLVPLSYSIDDGVPIIKDIKAEPSKQVQGENVNISCQVIDDDLLDVRVIIQFPNGTCLNESMQKGKTSFYYNNTYMDTGFYTYYIWAVDENSNSNASLPSIFEIIEDDIPPHTIVNITGLEGTNEWYRSQVVVQLSAEDIGMGIYAIFYQVGAMFWRAYDGPFIIESEGKHLLSYYAVDKKWNEEQINSTEIKIDETPPFTNYKIKGNMSNGWYIDEARVILNGSDTLSGINKTFYKIDEEEWQVYTDTLVIDETGKHEIRFYSVDMAGNVEEEKIITLKVDRISPNIIIEKPREGYLYIANREIIPVATGNTIVIGNINVKAYAYDEEGIEKVEFYFDGVLKKVDEKEPYSWMCSEKTVGSHVIKAIAYDKAGNNSEDEIKCFLINIV